MAGDLYNYYIKLIDDNSKELAKELNDLPNSEIIDIFISVANRMDIFISFMSSTFSYMDFYYTKLYNLDKLVKCALKIYKNNIFLPVQNQLTDAVNKLLKEDRYGQRGNRIKIKRVLNIMKTMDLTNPIIKTKEDVIFWLNETNEKYDTPIQNYWFDLFLKDTQQFASSKAILDIQNRSTPEYVLIELKFLEEENIRQKELLNEIFLEKLNDNKSSKRD